MNVAYEEDSYDEDFKLQVSKVMVEVEDYESAYKILQKAVDQNDKNGELLYMFAFCSWKLQKYVEAMKLVNGILSMGEVKDDQVSLKFYIFNRSYIKAHQNYRVSYKRWISLNVKHSRIMKMNGWMWSEILYIFFKFI